MVSWRRRVECWRRRSRFRRATRLTGRGSTSTWNAPRHGSLCFHPSLLPAFRGGAALAWQIMLGAKESGVSVFRVTDGVDAGPLLVQRGGVEIEPSDTMGSLYFDKLFPMGVTAVLDAVNAVAEGNAQYVDQVEQGASEQGLVTANVARIDWEQTAVDVDRKIRGCDPSPGAVAELEEEPVCLFGARLAETESAATPGKVIGVEGGALQIACGRGSIVVEKARRPKGKKLSASELGIRENGRFH